MTADRRADPAGRYETWRALARSLLADGTPPDHVQWVDSAASDTPPLFEADPVEPTARASVDVPKRFLDIAARVACHRDADRWALLYRILWRLVAQRERGLLDLASDPDVRRLALLEKQVRFDAHKMKAFVRFRKIEEAGPRGADEADEADGERFVAWHRPAHRVVRLVAPFFRKRFAVMRWTIFTPDESVDWDGTTLTYGDGVPQDAVDATDGLDDVWRTYYRAIFNPARVKLGAMLREMPRRYWRSMPETDVITSLLREAPERVRTMTERASGPAATALDFLPPPAERSLAALERALAHCEGCDLHELGRPAVFGEGPPDAELMIVGEQPGDTEDRERRPFIGPAGELLDRAFTAAGIDRRDVWVTNAVKHFRYVERGKMRLHKTPRLRQVQACTPWLRAEVDALQPRVIVALGVTAAKQLLGPHVRIAADRGRLVEGGAWAQGVIASWHPAAILRAADAARTSMFDQLVRDLETARSFGT